MLSKELTNVRVAPGPGKKNPWGNATWKKGYIMEKEAAKEWADERMLRLQTAQSYIASNISHPYTAPNPYVLNMRLVHENPVYNAINKYNKKVNYIHRFTYYDPVAEGPAPKKPLYSGNNFFMNLT